MRGSERDRADPLARARAGDEDAFRELTDRYRRELQLHIYRIVGSTQDAEDVLQETLLAAWRGLEEFEGRASVRAWLYRIATNRSLDALRASKRRPEEERMTQMPEPTRWSEPIWLEPYPDVLLESVPDDAPGPDARYEADEAIALAFIVGLQHLPPQQRAVLVLRDVLGFRAAEVAEMLDTSKPSVNSVLRRARAAFETRLPATGRERAPLPNSKREREIVGRLADAFETGDIDGTVAQLTDDAWLTMPPEPYEAIQPSSSERRQDEDHGDGGGKDSNAHRRDVSGPTAPLKATRRQAAKRVPSGLSHHPSRWPQQYLLTPESSQEKPNLALQRR